METARAVADEVAALERWSEGLAEVHERVALSYRDAEELLAERGGIVIHEIIRRWCQTFGQQYADALRRRRPRPGDTWHLDAGVIRINGQQRYL